MKIGNMITWTNNSKSLLRQPMTSRTVWMELLMKQLRDVSVTLGTLAKFCGDIHLQAGHCGQLPSNLVQLAGKLEMKTIKPLQTNIDEQVMRPIADYLEKFVPVEQLQRKRRNFILDMDFYRDKVASLQGKNPVQLSVQKEKLRVAKELFYDIDMVTKTSMVAHKLKQYEMIDSIGYDLFISIKEYTELLNGCVTVVAHRDPDPDIAALCSVQRENVSPSISDELETFTSLSMNEVLDVNLFAPVKPLSVEPSSSIAPRVHELVQDKRRILIITSNEGGGHAAATRAVQRALPQNQYEIYTVLPTEEIPCSSMYNTLMKKGQYRALGSLVRMQGTAETFVMGKPRKTVAKEMDRIKPHLVISVIPVMTKIIMKLATERNIPMMVIPTDLTFDHFFCHIKSVPSNFRVALPFSDMPDKQVLMSTRGFKENNFVVTGYPLRPEFGFSKDQLAVQYSLIQKELGIGANDRVMVIMMGAQGSEQQTLHYISKIVKDTWKVCSADFTIHIVAMCGENDKLRRLISYMTTIESLKLHSLPKVNGEYVAALLKFSDVFISKPGGSSVNESLALGVYTLYDDASTEGLWWEGANMKYAINHHGGEVIHDFTQQVRTILRNIHPKQELEGCPGRYFDRNIVAMVDEMIMNVR